MSDEMFTGYRLFMASQDTIGVGHFNRYPRTNSDLFVTDDIYKTEREAEEALILLKRELNISLTVKEKVLQYKMQQRQNKEFLIRELDSLVDHLQKAGLTSTEIWEHFMQMRPPAHFRTAPSIDYMDYVHTKLFGEKKEEAEESIQ